MIRQWKRVEAGSLTLPERENAARHVVAWQARQRELIKESNAERLYLYRQSNREQIGGETTPKLPFAREIYQNNLTKTAESVNIGTESGAVKDPKRQEAHAELYYEEIRKRTSDVKTIAEHTGYSEKTVQRIKNHMFVNEYDLAKGYARFDPDYWQAESWRRLQEGKNILEEDLILLKHEELEERLMNEAGFVYEGVVYNRLSYDEAHDIANARYDYQDAINKRLDKEEKKNG
jgi:hypothetical protein